LGAEEITAIITFLIYLPTFEVVFFKVVLGGASLHKGHFFRCYYVRGCVVKRNSIFALDLMGWGFFVQSTLYKLITLFQRVVLYL